MYSSSARHEGIISLPGNDVRAPLAARVAGRQESSQQRREEVDGGVLFICETQENSAMTEGLELVKKLCASPIWGKSARPCPVSPGFLALRLGTLGRAPPPPHPRATAIVQTLRCLI